MATVTTKVPNKPAAAGLTSPLSVVLVWIAGEYGLDVPPEVALAFGSLLATAAYYFTPAKEM